MPTMSFWQPAQPHVLPLLNWSRSPLERHSWSRMAKQLSFCRTVYAAHEQSGFFLGRRSGLVPREQQTGDRSLRLLHQVSLPPLNLYSWSSLRPPHRWLAMDQQLSPACTCTYLQLPSGLGAGSMFGLSPAVQQT